MWHLTKTPKMYDNEAATGKSINNFLAGAKNTDGLKREDVHYTTKLSSNGAYDEARKSISQSVKRSGLGYVDLFLLHSPYGGKKARLESWRALEDAVLADEVKIAGVSNWGSRHIEELVASKPRTLPVVNQIEVHPFNTRTGIRDTCAKYGIQVEAYAPLARALRMKHPKIVELANKYACTPGQLMLRWSVQHGMVPLPKSVQRQRIFENGQLSSFEISTDDMKAMDALDEYLVTDWDPVDCP